MPNVQRYLCNWHLVVRPLNPNCCPLFPKKKICLLGMWRTAAPRGLEVSELTQKHVRANKVFHFHLPPFDSVAGALSF